MDRTLKVYAKTGHLFAEFVFKYEASRQLKVQYISYRRLYDEGEDYPEKSVYAMDNGDNRGDYREYSSIDQIKAADIDYVKKEAGRDMKDPATAYKYVYDDQPVLMRYVVANPRGVVGMVNIMFSFIGNTKEVKFLSGTNPRFDFDMTANSLKTNVACLLEIPVYTDRDTQQISMYDVKVLPAWY